MSDNLFDIPASEPPLEVELRHAREQLAIAESALADAEDNSDKTRAKGASNGE